MRKTILLTLFFLLGCTHSPSIQNRPLLLVSVAPYRFLTERIAGDAFEVHNLVPAAANPHSFEPTAFQVSTMGRGLVWFRIGEPFEIKLLPLLKEHNPDLKVCDLRDGIALRHEGCCSKESADHHIWMSPKKTAQQAALIASSLSERFPEKQELFAKNLALLTEELASLDQEIQEILKPVRKRTILVSHPAFGYFCEDYHLNQMSVELEGKDPRPKHLSEILAYTEGFEVALALPQHNNRGAQMIADELHLPIRWIDPYSMNYFETMRSLAKMIAAPYAN